MNVTGPENNFTLTNLKILLFQCNSAAIFSATSSRHVNRVQREKQTWRIILITKLDIQHF